MLGKMVKRCDQSRHWAKMCGMDMGSEERRSKEKSKLGMFSRSSRISVSKVNFKRL